MREAGEEALPEAMQGRAGHLLAMSARPGVVDELATTLLAYVPRHVARPVRARTRRGRLSCGPRTH